MKVDGKCSIRVAFALFHWEKFVQYSHNFKKESVIPHAYGGDKTRAAHAVICQCYHKTKRSRPAELVRQFQFILFSQTIDSIIGVGRKLKVGRLTPKNILFMSYPPPKKKTQTTPK